MNVSCPECRSVFRLDPAKITSLSMRARCSVCGGLIPVGAAVQWGDEMPATPTRQASPARMGSTPSGVRPVLASAQAGHGAAPAPARDVGRHAAWPPVVPGTAPSREPSPARAPSPTPVPPRPTVAEPLAPAPVPQPPPRTPPFSPRQGVAVQQDSPASVRRGPEYPEAVPISSPSPLDTPTQPLAGAPFGAPLTPPPRTAIPPAPAASAAGRTPFAGTGNLSAALSTPSTPSPPPSAVGGSQRRPINPFLANDPNQKARRLARALVSDMVAYHPSRREEGLQQGTLKLLFRDEIKKSYEEYVEQVGREFAESTVHFQEALNDVLAGGRKIF